MKAILLMQIILFISLLSFAQDEFIPLQNSENLKAEFEKNSGKLISIKSDFVQEKHLAFLSSTVISKGKFWYKKENKLRWEYTEPFKYLVVVNGDKITVRDENNTSVYKKQPNKTFQQLNEILASSVKGNLINDKQYTFKVSQSSNQFLVELFPNTDETKQIFSSIKLFFNKSNMDVFKIILLEPNNDSISITFSNKEVNTAILDGIFKVE